MQDPNPLRDFHTHINPENLNLADYSQSLSPYPFSGAGHLLALGLVQRVVVEPGRASVQVHQHGVGVLHGGHGALGDALVDGLVDGDDGGVH